MPPGSSAALPLGTAAGTRLPQPVSLLDVLPSLAALASIPATTHPLDGTSLLPLLRRGRPAAPSTDADSETDAAAAPADSASAVRRRPSTEGGKVGGGEVWERGGVLTSYQVRVRADAGNIRHSKRPVALRYLSPTLGF